jgi:hypothetical protein
MGMTFRRYALAVAGALLLMPLAASCESFNQHCTDQADCDGGNEQDIEACEVSNEAESDRASLYGCSEFFDLRQECIESNADCENDVYGLEGDDCQEELLDYENCMSG